MTALPQPINPPTAAPGQPVPPIDFRALARSLFERQPRIGQRQVFPALNATAPAPAPAKAASAGRDPMRFKLGFLRGLARAGVRPTQLVDAMHKSANTTAALGDAFKTLAYMSLLVPAVGGALAGGALHHMQSTEEPTLADVQSEELERMYRTAAQRIRTQMERRRGGSLYEQPAASGTGSTGHRPEFEL